MEISAERLDEPKKKFWLVLSQLISRAAAAATACIAWGEGTILATYWWIFRAQKVLLRHHRLLPIQWTFLGTYFLLICHIETLYVPISLVKNARVISYFTTILEKMLKNAKWCLKFCLVT